MPASSQATPQRTLHSLDFLPISIMLKFPKPSVFRPFIVELENKMSSCIYFPSCNIRHCQVIHKIKDIFLLDLTEQQRHFFSSFFLHLRRGEWSGLACLHVPKLRYDFKPPNREIEKIQKCLHFFHHTFKVSIRGSYIKRKRKA